MSVVLLNDFKNQLNPKFFDNLESSKFEDEQKVNFAQMALGIQQHPRAHDLWAATVRYKYVPSINLFIKDIRIPGPPRMTFLGDPLMADTAYNYVQIRQHTELESNGVGHLVNSVKTLSKDEMDNLVASLIKEPRPWIRAQIVNASKFFNVNFSPDTTDALDFDDKETEKMAYAAANLVSANVGTN